ncbi:MAG: hypothetical protein HC830_00060 [Bacteroidetes bacterium]|nr:hypothetical protein [Bacteroidota bacterium]
MILLKNIVISTVVCFVILWAAGCTKNAYLSDLNAHADSPLFTTYTAAAGRSEFQLDQGYHLSFYENDEGIDLITDTGGDLALGFKINGSWHYRLSGMHSKPVITLSYPDMVKYHYYPVKGLKTEITFLVQSSHLAIQDIVLTNESGVKIDAEIVPFMKNGYRAFLDVQPDKENSAFFFKHEELPDEWTLSHKIPYVDTIYNVYLFSQPPDRYGIYNTMGEDPPVIPFAAMRDTPSVFRINGRSFLQNGERNTTVAPLSRIQIFINGNQESLITENSPVWGENREILARGGYFSCELGHFGAIKAGDEYSFTFFLENGHLGERYTDTINSPEAGKLRKDVSLKPYDLLPVPEDVTILVNNGVAEISWNHDHYKGSYNLYRRDYPRGIYRLVGSNLTGTSFQDNLSDPSRLYGYVVAATDGHTIGMHSREVNTTAVFSFAGSAGSSSLSEVENVKVISFHKKISLPPNGTRSLRIIRKVGRKGETKEKLVADAQMMMKEKTSAYIRDNEKFYVKAASPQFVDAEKEMLWWSSFNMMRGVFLQPEAKAGFNYYVFSREPVWGWGHGGQVFHESIAMLAYAYIDPLGAMNSQRIYRERQRPDGYINYRSGPYLDEVIEHNGEFTSSAPWYSWINWEIYSITKDKVFLKEMYISGKAFHDYFVKNRDKDNDGLCEWGAHAVLESVRDALVAVWDETGWPSNFEGVDVNSMLVMEAKSLELMARELGLDADARMWNDSWVKRAELINKYCWDPQTQFYYNVDKTDHDFSFRKEGDLKRMEIIGFLPLWAGIVPEERVKPLLSHLFDADKFWRKYGVPSLSAHDPYYNDTGYWNGPVWVQWNFLVVRGLIHYGYMDQARDLVHRVSRNMIAQLKKDHNLWEFYSPDKNWAGYHKTYIWAGIINKMMLDVMKE